MTTEQTAQQFELAAKILRTGHPWEWQASDGEWVKPTIRTELHHVISDGLAIRLALATPPDGRPLHNPDNLTAEQVGVRYRLALPEEMDGRFWNGRDKCEWWSRHEGWKSSHHLFCHNHAKDTLRLPLSVPWPEAKPEAPPFQLPPPPPGMQWHRTDCWQDGDLPQGWRPLVLDEESKPGDEHWTLGRGPWKALNLGGFIYDEGHTRCRTRRPLTFTHAEKTWTYHRPGDPTPCEHGKNIEIYMLDGQIGKGNSASYGYWDKLDHATIIGWRYADEKKIVPLGPEDVMPCSLFRVKGKGSSGWHQMRECPQWDGLFFNSDVWVSYEELMRVWLINRSIPLTGKWNPDAWEPCHKEIDA